MDNIILLIIPEHLLSSKVAYLWQFKKSQPVIT